MRTIAGAVLLVLLGVSCTEGSGTGREAPRPAFSGISVSTSSGSPRYDFAGVTTALDERGVKLDPLRDLDWERLRSTPRPSLRALAWVLDHHFGNLIVGLHIGRVNIDDARLRVRNRLTYIVEITGSPTGNCIYLYDATSGGGYVGACFYEERIHPSVRP
jgi:hypothetical protein